MAVDKFRRSIAISTSVIFGLIGFALAFIIPLPPPATLTQTKVLYVLIGLFLASMYFSRLASWILVTTTTLFRQLVWYLASETINQLHNLTTSGLHLGQSLTSDHSQRIINPLIIDTSSLIDGRVLDVAKSGFISGIVLIPDFVLRELQNVADSANSIKRTRGRRGFIIVEELKKIEGIKLNIWDKGTRGQEVDEKLIKLAKSLKGRILTVDYNLNRVASLSNVRVLNVNELGNALKTLPVPGETIKIKVAHLGKDRSQGVGYLADGTMIVIKDGAEELDKTIEVEVSKILQGSAGRMIFAAVI
ncbi:hypothetical protein A2780_03785 [Candidatus Daviesbacteria bacterium RIFCSPHIGHO2_01_FULL_41_45]|uniref:TRAM domain-containing protein n=1 Tax=Candidatus Daviesbacteria bacterium RIFCSPLOWO2_01_FULL_40_24 TaxID=1797787 RepID=A0A1F5MIF1_9BACT|nr:MAG: hypothetical protein A2780_03785 [Candidatus Daviesbacteria bacterium RIFCSPHIGHO2_01_FULL_41_45]OGE65128.1 MAG: hypothetical protein A3B49_03100 [Candidatus Daviesbacteria bacterium RIFCSPLOWO2_01_FULL_40_24]